MCDFNTFLLLYLNADVCGSVWSREAESVSIGLHGHSGFKLEPWSILLPVVAFHCAGLLCGCLCAVLTSPKADLK